jgi:holo-[acyl-carrier protein] synthase
MIKGIGIDIVEIKRVKKLIKQYGNRFLKRTFTSIEIQYCQNKPNPAQHFAGKFAAKEALIKAFGKPLTLNEIEVENIAGKKPQIKLCGTAKTASSKINILVSISHDHEYAIAEVIIESKQKH